MRILIWSCSIGWKRKSTFWNEFMEISTSWISCMGWKGKK